MLTTTTATLDDALVSTPTFSAFGVPRLREF
jgi:hypothetical protein